VAVNLRDAAIAWHRANVCLHIIGGGINGNLKTWRKITLLSAWAENEGLKMKIEKPLKEADTDSG